MTSNRLPHFLCAVAAFTASLMLTGCGMGTPASTASLESSPLALGGHVHGGQQPVTQSHVALFSTTSAGYGGAATLLASTTTDGNGNFVITSSYTCPSTQQAYLVSTGGNPGLASGTDNSAIFLMAALGPCTGVSSGTLADIDEVTTVAAAYALSGFVPAGGNGMTEAAVTGTSVGSTMPGATTSAGNAQGLVDAFANANNIVSFTTGLAYTAPPSNASGVVPQSIIHALADILQPCVNSSGPAQPACTALFAAAKPPAGSSITSAPVNVFQAAVDIALYPGANPGGLYSLISSSAAFPYTLSAAPNDWTIGVTYNYPATALVSGLGMGIDNYDNVYVTGSTAASTGTDLLLMSPQGTLLSSSLMSTISTKNNIRYIGFDSSNNAYLSNGNAADIYKFAPTTANAPGSGGTVSTLSYATVSDTGNNYALAVDKLGDVWTSGYKKSTCAGAPSSTNTLSCSLIEFPVSAQSSPVVSFSGFNDVEPGIGGSRGLAFDVKTGNVWTTDINNSNLTLFPVTPSATGPATATGNPNSVVLSSVANSNAGFGSVGVAIDANSNAWSVVTGSGASATIVPAGLYKVTSSLSPTAISSTATTGLLVEPAYLAIDGAGNIFIANNSGSAGIGVTGAIAQYSPSFSSNAGAWLSPYYGFSPGTTFSGGTGASATATESGGVVTGITLNSGGSGYASTTTITLSGGGSTTAATATATVSDGVVTGITLVSGGAGYTSAPTVNINAYVGAGSLYEPNYVAVDRSGAVWALSSGSNGTTSLANLVQILGVGAPTDPVQADGNYGVKP